MGHIYNIVYLQRFIYTFCTFDLEFQSILKTVKYKIQHSYLHQ